MTRQIWQWRGKSSFRGGRKVVGTPLTACPGGDGDTPDAQAKYQAMIKAGSHPKFAITVLMRGKLA